MREWYTYENEIRAYSGSDEDVTIPRNINKHDLYIINDFAFSPVKKNIKPDVRQRRLNIKRVEVSEGYSQIRESAFDGCQSLQSIKIPKSVKYIGSRAFANTGLTEIFIPNATELGNEICEECVNLARVEIGGNIKELGGSLFEFCENLKEVTIPPTLMAIPPAFVRGCPNLTRFNIPPDVEVIDVYAFDGCGFEEIIIPAKVTHIGAAAFKNCRMLKKIVFEGNSVVSIGQWAFSGCEALEELVLPDSIRRIEGDLFTECKNLKKVTFPSEVYEINPNSFIGADKLEHIVVKGKNTKIVQRGDKTFTPPNDFCVVGPRGSFAESYAKELGITFEAF